MWWTHAVNLLKKRFNNEECDHGKSSFEPLSRIANYETINTEKICNGLFKIEFAALFNTCVLTNPDLLAQTNNTEFIQQFGSKT